MLELGVSQAQVQFTQLLNEKAHHKKVVILPYEEYSRLIIKASNNNRALEDSVFSQFVGILDNDFKSDDIKYNEIIK